MAEITAVPTAIIASARRTSFHRGWSPIQGRSRSARITSGTSSAIIADNAAHTPMTASMITMRPHRFDCVSIPVTSSSVILTVNVRRDRGPHDPAAQPRDTQCLIAHGRVVGVPIGNGFGDRCLVVLAPAPADQRIVQNCCRRVRAVFRHEPGRRNGIDAKSVELLATSLGTRYQ